jgi:hypothetical protein
MSEDKKTIYINLEILHKDPQVVKNVLREMLDEWLGSDNYTIWRFREEEE